MLETQVVEAAPANSLPAKSAEVRSQVCRLTGRLCGGETFIETVTTQLHVAASPESVWDRIVFYEEVPRRPPLLLGALLPRPVRTQGDKTCLGATVECIYSGGGRLAKRITGVDPPRLLQFEVMQQFLGIEDCLVTLGGSYQIESCGSASHVLLRTHYEARLHPRGLWYPIEAFLVGQLHRHILHGLSCEAHAENRVLSPASLATSRGLPGGLACKLQSRSHL